MEAIDVGDGVGPAGGTEGVPQLPEESAGQGGIGQEEERRPVAAPNGVEGGCDAGEAEGAGEQCEGGHPGQKEKRIGEEGNEGQQDDAEEGGEPRGVGNVPVRAVGKAVAQGGEGGEQVADFEYGRQDG